MKKPLKNLGEPRKDETGFVGFWVVAIEDLKLIKIRKIVFLTIIPNWVWLQEEIDHVYICEQEEIN
ncbi:hypothetical protein Hanom_Chr04g00347941 [Helianthus anomalus]